jgi:Tol biopolymer transport system component
MSSKPASRLLLSLAVAGLLPACGNVNDGHPAVPFTILASVSSAGALGNFNSNEVAVSGDGRFVAFASQSTTLVALNTNGIKNIFRRDLETGVTELVSIGVNGLPADQACAHPSISHDGRWVAFDSTAELTALTPDGPEVYRRDMEASPGSGIEMVSSVAGDDGDGDSIEPSISADGRFVAFASKAVNFGNGPANGVFMIYRRDMNGTEILPVSVTVAQGEPTPGLGADPDFPGSRSPSISADGSRVAFVSDCSDLVGLDLNEIDDVFVATIGPTIDTVLASPGTLGLGGGAGPSAAPSLSGDGLFVAFESSATDLVPLDTNDTTLDIFVFDIVGSTVSLASTNAAGFQGAVSDDSTKPSMSFDGRYVAFSSVASNLVERDPNQGGDIFIKDLLTGAVVHASVSTSGVQGGPNENSRAPSLSADGRTVAFDSEAPLVREDVNSVKDVYVRSPLK